MYLRLPARLQRQPLQYLESPIQDQGLSFVLFLQYIVNHQLKTRLIDSNLKMEALQKEVERLRNRKRCGKRAERGQPAAFNAIAKRSPEERRRAVRLEQPEVKQRECTKIHQRRDSAHQHKQKKLPQPGMRFHPMAKATRLFLFHLFSLSRRGASARTHATFVAIP